ncbi:MAG: hypothetical protein M3083_09590, partial [Actinomycetota bacterium]|nr:hypothetical protein [Actinomycetota bacterium]
MTDPIEDPMDDQLRQALNSEAARFSPAPTIGATRGQLVGQVHRRQRRLLALTVVALVLVCGSVALGARRSGPSPARQVAAAGTNRLNTAATNGPGGSPAPAPSTAPVPQPAGQPSGGFGGPGASAVSSAP